MIATTRLQLCVSKINREIIEYIFNRDMLVEHLAIRFSATHHINAQYRLTHLGAAFQHIPK